MNCTNECEAAAVIDMLPRRLHLNSRDFNFERHPFGQDEQGRVVGHDRQATDNRHGNDQDVVQCFLLVGWGSGNPEPQRPGLVAFQPTKEPARGVSATLRVGQGPRASLTVRSAPTERHTACRPARVSTCQIEISQTVRASHLGRSRLS